MNNDFISAIQTQRAAEMLRQKPVDTDCRFLAVVCWGLRGVLYCSVKNETSSGLVQENESARQRLNEVRGALLELHKVLLASERVSYEQVFGKVGSSYNFLQMLTTDPWFAWLQPMTRLIASVDELLDGGEPLNDSAVETLVGRIKSLLMPTPEGEGFSKHYDDALQRDPDLVYAHACVCRMIRAQARRPVGL